MRKVSLIGAVSLVTLLIGTVYPCPGQVVTPDRGNRNDLGFSWNTAELDLAFAGVVRSAFPVIMASGTTTERSLFPKVVFFSDDAQVNPQQPQPPAPPASSTRNSGAAGPPSLGDLGFSPAQTQPDPQEQARLDKRSHMLRIHQRLGLITTVPLIATVVSGAFAGGKSTSSSSRDLHAALGSVTAGLYFTTAYFSVFAPRIPETSTRGQIRLHKALAWIHGPGMILTPVLGAMAFEQKSNGEKIHGIASAHGAVGVVTAAAYGLAIVSVSIRF